MKMRMSLRILPIAAAVMLMMPVTAAEAGIRCVDGFQIVNGSRISTPYCQDNYLARIASSYGIRVSAASVRNNPLVKRDLCNFVGHDPRVHQSCAGSGFDLRSRSR